MGGIRKAVRNYGSWERGRNGKYLFVFNLGNSLTKSNGICENKSHKLWQTNKEYSFERDLTKKAKWPNVSLCLFVASTQCFVYKYICFVYKYICGPMSCVRTRSHQSIPATQVIYPTTRKRQTEKQAEIICTFTTFHPNSIVRFLLFLCFSRCWKGHFY